ncbi:hypothetical protein BD769DRAFT_1662865 [Suillus cothurnatus]|nr:hypothetical protein BD769DRAFT_1662865 [Suillus cothurnatus]
MATRSGRYFESSEMTKKRSKTAAYDITTWSLRDRQSRQTYTRDVSVAGDVEGPDKGLMQDSPQPLPHNKFLFYVPIAVAAGDPQLQAQNSHLPPPSPSLLLLPSPPPPPSPSPPPPPSPLPPPPPSPLPPPPPPPSSSSPLHPPLSDPSPPPAVPSPLPLLEPDDALVRAAELYHQFESDIPPYLMQHWDLAHHRMWSECIQLESPEES